jgi:flagellar P-ring protein precursor FlgI
MRKIWIAILLVCLTLSAKPAHAVKVADISRIGGQRTNQLVGIGLVYGLKGTGDGGDFLPAIRPLAAMLTKLANPPKFANSPTSPTSPSSASPRPSRVTGRVTATRSTSTSPAWAPPAA